MAAESLRIEMFGGLRIRKGEQIMVRFGYRKTGLLLAYLAYYPRRVHAREALCELLWPDTEPEVGRHNLRQALLTLRRRLERPGETAQVLLSDNNTIRLDPDRITTDIAAFESTLEAAALESELSAQIARFQQAIALYQGELLPGFYEDWVLAERDRQVEAYQRALMAVMRGLQWIGDLEGAIDCALRSLQLDPLREPVVSQLIELYLSSGRRADALRLFRRYEIRLMAELGATPAPEIRFLAQKAQADGNNVQAVAPLPPAPLKSEIQKK